MSWLKRQSFLGEQSDATFRNAKVAIIGLGGGGSHGAQQLAHVGIGGFLLVDPDHIEEHNLNRLVGGTRKDVRRRTPKVRIAERVIRGINPEAEVTLRRQPWEAVLDEIRSCDVVLGCVDTFSGRDELERFCRQHLLPYVDMGMDVTETDTGFLVAGQVLLSLPDEPCLRCVGVVTDERIKREAEQYGAAGPRPQVVWSNGTLASLAVGMVVQMLSPWNTQIQGSAYREYDGNANTVRESPKWPFLVNRTCPHHPSQDRGDPSFDIRDWPNRPESGTASDSDLLGFGCLVSTWLRRLFKR